MMLEIERRWLWHGPLPPHFFAELVQQGYIAYSETTSVRVRRSVTCGRRARCELTVKVGSGLVRPEVNLPLTLEQFRELWRTVPIANRITKLRYHSRGRQELVVDIFGKQLRGLCIAEVEFSSREAAEAFVPHNFGVEVTDDPRYSNFQLALHGLPR